MINDSLFRMLQLGHQGYCCSQILVALALETRSETNPALVRSMAGLCNGIGNNGEICGALSGAACLLALYAAKGSDEEQEDERLSLMIAELFEWFEENVAVNYGGPKCSDITGEAFPGKPDMSRCGNIVAETYGKSQEILVNNGFDPAQR
jgi:C_GCAxxG_C_C family probable redox protein